MKEPFNIAIWGIASGRGSTEGATRGAFTVREYQTKMAAKEAQERGDWLDVITQQKEPHP